jgi:imidazolonepropionase
MKILIRNIKELIQTEEIARIKVAGRDMASLPTIENAWVFIEDGLIKGFGNMAAFAASEFAGLAGQSDVTHIDATGKMVFPSFCDSHTHIVYAGSREIEYIDKIKGLSYEEIAKRGGGILNSAKRLQQASEEELIEQAMERLEEIKFLGTGAVEIKSGYGLTTESELKMLRVIQKLKRPQPAHHKSHFSGRSCRASRIQAAARPNMLT